MCRGWTKSAVQIAAICLLASAAHGQQTTVGGSFGRQSDGFHEQIGVGWGLNFPGGRFQFGPQGADPNQAGGQAGIGFGNGDVNGRLNIFGAQSSQRSSSSFAPSATMMNGYGAMIADTRQYPFVIGVVPVVGGYPGFSGGALFNQAAPAPIQERVARLNEEPRRRVPAKPAPARPALDPRERAERPAVDRLDPVASKLAAARESTAGQGAASVADIRRAQQAAHDAAEDELADVLTSARQAEADGKLASARIFYQMAARRASEPQKSELIAKLRQLGR